MKRFAMGAGLLAVVVGVLAATGVLQSAVDAIPESDCPYGSGSSASASRGCKPRPQPSDGQRASVRDASALAAALQAFRRSEHRESKVVGVGLNKWGETTFSLGDGHVTFDREGGLPSQSKPAQRHYEIIEIGGEPFSVARVKAAVLRRAIGRIARGAPSARFEAATFARSPVGLQQVWMLRWLKGSGDSTSGILLQMKPDGSGLCRLGERSEIRGVRSCSPAVLGMQPTVPAPGAPDPGADERAACIRKAGTDVAKAQACITG